MKKLLKVVLWIIGVPISLFILFVAISTVFEYRPDDQEIIYEGPESDILPDTLTIMSWNIGYAGLGDNMDYFYDGGKMVRDSRERTEENLSNIISELKKADADVYFLQEVDKKAHRSYNIDEIQMLADAFPEYYLYYAPNYKAWFVPIPLKEPIGNVDGGLVILSKYLPSKVVRYQYPSKFPYPMSTCNLKRCLEAAYFSTKDGGEIVLGNTHCTAFDTGNMRQVESEFIFNMLSSLKESGSEFVFGGDWNQYPPEYFPSKEELENEFFKPEKLSMDRLDEVGSVVCDLTCHTARFNDFVYSETSTRTLLDFFIVSEGVDEVSMVARDLQFHSSDHNPVIMKIAIK